MHPFAALAALDRSLFLLLNTGPANPLFDFIFIRGTEAEFWIIPGVAAALLFIFRKRGEAAVVIGLALLTVAVTDPLGARILKPLFGRMRPCHPEYFVAGGRFLCGMKHSLSFPSIHAMNIFAQATLFTCFYPRWKWVYIMFACFIGYSRIYVGVHYPGDVTAGAVAGIAVAVGIMYLYRRYGEIIVGKLGKTGKKTATDTATQSPEAALIIAVYNHIDFLEKVFCSLLRQTARNFEVVIADDGSGPEMVRFLEQQRAVLPFTLKHVSHTDHGFRKTVIVNKAVMATEAPYCIFIDGDCILHHRFIEYHLKRKRRGTVLSGRRVMMNRELSLQVTCDDITSGRIEKKAFWWGKCNRAGYRHGLFLPGIFYLKNIKKRKIHDILGSNFSVHRDDFIAINGYDERIIGRGLEDDNLSIRFWMAGIPVKTVAQEALQYHLDHSADPIPHDNAFKEKFRNSPEHARTPWGIVREAELQ